MLGGRLKGRYGDCARNSRLVISKVKEACIDVGRLRTTSTPNEQKKLSRKFVCRDLSRMLYISIGRGGVVYGSGSLGC